MDIPVYNSTGEHILSLEINDDITFVEGRISKGNSIYYKGVGIPYTGHMIDKEKFNELDYRFISETGISYAGIKVYKKAFHHKHGVFQEQYQPQFTDHIGTCGVKELSILENSELFERSSAVVKESINWDKENGQYIFVLDYKCKRQKYKNESKNLRDLLDYMTQSHWNFPWDKDSITDISYNGLVSDVADIFFSKDLKYKLGSVYSVLYSLRNKDEVSYLSFYDYNKFDPSEDTIFIAAKILEENGIDISPLLPHTKKVDNYKHMLLNYLIEGKNCAHCSFLDIGDIAKENYREQILKL